MPLDKNYRSIINQFAKTRMQIVYQIKWLK